MAERETAPVRTVIGLMSGTSADGIDAAIMETDGEDYVASGKALSVPYDAECRALIKRAMAEARAWDVSRPWSQDIAALFEEATRALTLAHGEAVRTLLRRAGLAARDVDLVGFHGQTVLHRPARRDRPEGAGMTLQLGDAALLARETGIGVVSDFRSADVAAGGEGAPLAPLYHEVLVRALGLNGPVAVLNIGGVANLTYVPADPAAPLLAFDIGPGNGPIDDWVERHTGARFDADGALARAGRVNEEVLGRLLAQGQAFFAKKPPKSLDRYDFSDEPVRALKLEDGAATLTAFVAASVVPALAHLPLPPLKWIVCGGGRHNRTLMEKLSRRVDVPVVPAEAVGWRGDSLEAEAFAYLAVRSRRVLPLTLPTTTGVPAPLSGGVFTPAPGADAA